MLKYETLTDRYWDTEAKCWVNAMDKDSYARQVLRAAIERLCRIVARRSNA